MTTSDEGIRCKTLAQLIAEQQARPLPSPRDPLTTHQRAVYDAISKAGTVTTASLADLMGSTTSGAAQILRALEQKGALVRHEGTVKGSRRVTYSVIEGK